MFVVKVENKKQFEIVLSNNNVKEIILARDSFAENEICKIVDIISKNKKKAGIMFERISRYEENENLRKTTDVLLEIENVNKIVIQNLDSFAYMLRKIRFVKNKNLEVELNWTMNCYNIETKKIYNQLYYDITGKNLLYTAPVELNHYELDDVGYDTMVVYGYIDTMVSANCLYKNTMKKCLSKDYKDNGKFKNFDLSSRNTIGFLKDRKNKKLFYKTYCKYCYNKIFNTVPLYIIDEKELYKKMNARIDFTIENEEEVKNILNNKMPNEWTRGHIKNTIQ